MSHLFGPFTSALTLKQFCLPLPDESFSNTLIKEKHNTYRERNAPLPVSSTIWTALLYNYPLTITVNSFQQISPQPFSRQILWGLNYAKGKRWQRFVLVSKTSFNISYSLCCMSIFRLGIQSMNRALLSKHRLWFQSLIPQKTTQNILSQVWWRIPIIPGTQEFEAGN